jgi:hypothetical protein
VQSGALPVKQQRATSQTAWHWTKVVLTATAAREHLVDTSAAMAG